MGEALRLIGQRGFNGSTIRELALACGLSQAGMLHYFSSKDELLAGAIDHFRTCEEAAVAHLVSACEAKVRQGKSALAEFTQLLREVLARNITNPEIARFVVVIQAEALDPEHPAYETFCAMQAATLSFYRRILDPITADAEAAARGLYAAMFGLMQQWVRGPEKFDVGAQWEIVMLKLLSGSR